ncbi:hypothetical protein ACH4FA_12570 [Streptomyces sp. NPDC017966]|uniref:YunG family protein n=1 Tax=Streptomyces sp. NPDC017966 TaxID=3365023 RepID=UPI003794F90A
MSVRPGRVVEGCLRTGPGYVGGERVDHHWWNRLGRGVEIDLTREQFGPEGIVTEGVVIPRPPERAGLREEDGFLRDRVLEKLDRHDAAPAVGGGR